jgi:FkbM family methyltransferase
MAHALLKTRLPDGSTIHCLRANEVPTLYQQVEGYFKHGIGVRAGDTIFDVGANIGLFTLAALKRCHNQAKIYAFEPIPLIFKALSANAQEWNPESIRALNCGLSDETALLNFAYYPHATYLCNAYPNEIQESQEQLKQAILRNSQALPRTSLTRWLPSPLRSFMLDQYFKESFQAEIITAQVRPLSEIIREYAIAAIDLLKIDVEKAELKVLLGIEPQDWQKVKQIVVEVHDLENRLQQVHSLLTQKGFDRITVEQEPLLKGSNIFSLYALRSVNKSSDLC